MTTSARIGWGSVFQILTNDSPDSWLTIGEVKAMNLPEISRDATDATHEGLPGEFRDYVPGRLDGGEVTIELNMVPSVYNVLRAEFDRTVANNKRIVLYDGTTCLFSGFITGLSAPINVGDLISATAKFKVAGEPSLLTAGSPPS